MSFCVTSGKSFNNENRGSDNGVSIGLKKKTNIGYSKGFAQVLSTKLIHKKIFSHGCGFEYWPISEWLNF